MYGGNNMAKKPLRLLSAALALLMVTSSTVSASAATVELERSNAGLAKQYSTNSVGVGTNKTISVDGDLSD